MSASESEDDKNLCTPPEICEQAEVASLDLLPTKSKALYETCYDKYQEWKGTSNIQSSSEQVLLAYFNKLSKQYKPSSLWSHYSMLKTTIKIYEKLDIKLYRTILAFLKKQSHGFQSKKSKVLSAEDINKFLTEAPDEKYLLTKVVLVFGISGALGKDELTKITIQDIENYGDLILVKIPETKTAKARSFTIPPEFQKLVKSYLDLRPQHATSDRFFLNYRNNKCNQQVVGKNKFGGMPKEIASYLKLPDVDLYTGHCFRRTSATVLADTGANMTTLKRHGGWKSTSVAEGYIEESIQNKSKIGSIIISSAINLAKSADVDSNDTEEPPKKKPRLIDNFIIKSSSESHAVSSSNENRFFNFSNCAITINYKDL